MGLKVNILDSVRDSGSFDKIRPKWDWKNITNPIIPPSKPAIKSDQNGIERLFFLLVVLVRYFDKIRPKWDWKRSMGWARRRRWLSIKSDQNGIERFIKEGRKSQVSWIKSDQNGIESSLPLLLPCSQHHDKIRPKWDWKNFKYPS